MRDIVVNLFKKGDVVRLVMRDNLRRAALLGACRSPGNDDFNDYARKLKCKQEADDLEAMTVGSKYVVVSDQIQVTDLVGIKFDERIVWVSPYCLELVEAKAL
jgi:hypothetical protein